MDLFFKPMYGILWWECAIGIILSGGKNYQGLYNNSWCIQRKVRTILHRDWSWSTRGRESIIKRLVVQCRIQKGYTCFAKRVGFFRDKTRHCSQSMWWWQIWKQKQNITTNRGAPKKGTMSHANPNSKVVANELMRMLICIKIGWRLLEWND